MHWAYREFYDEQSTILAHWDQLNQQRKIVGIGAVDAHNNQGFRARRHADGMIEWVGPNADTLAYRKPTMLDKILLGKPDKYGWSFNMNLDPYFNSFNFVNNHVFCDTFSNINIKDHVIRGHVFVSFEHLAEANGFQYFAMDNQGAICAILGDSVSVDDAVELRAVSPLPVKFQLMQDGSLIDEKENQYDYSYRLDGDPGNYRLTAQVFLDDQWVSWIYTNPIYVYQQ